MFLPGKFVTSLCRPFLSASVAVKGLKQGRRHDPALDGQIRHYDAERNAPGPAKTMNNVISGCMGEGSSECRRLSRVPGVSGSGSVEGVAIVDNDNSRSVNLSRIWKNR